MSWSITIGVGLVAHGLRFFSYRFLTRTPVTSGQRDEANGFFWNTKVSRLRHNWRRRGGLVDLPRWRVRGRCTTLPRNAEASRGHVRRTASVLSKCEKSNETYRSTPPAPQAELHAP